MNTRSVTRLIIGIGIGLAMALTLNTPANADPTPPPANTSSPIIINDSASSPRVSAQFSGTDITSRAITQNFTVITTGMHGPLTITVNIAGLPNQTFTHVTNKSTLPVTVSNGTQGCTLISVRISDNHHHWATVTSNAAYTA